MTVRRLASTELARLARAPGVWIAAVLFGALLVAGVALPGLLLEEATPAIGTAYLLGPAVDVILPTIAIVLTYGAIAGVRSDGRIKVYLGMPVRRRDILLGIACSRIAIVWIVMMCGLFVGVATIGILYGRPPIRPILAFASLSLLASASFVGIGVGISALVGTPIRAIATLVGGFLLAHALWEPICRAAASLLIDDFTSESPPRWYELIILASPLEAYTTAANGVLPPSPHVAIAIGDGGARADSGALVGGEISTATLTIAIGWLVLWGLGSMLAGTVALRAAEIE